MSASDETIARDIGIRCRNPKSPLIESANVHATCRRGYPATHQNLSLGD
jgi:hypothetical protein